MAERLVCRSQRNDLASRRYAYIHLNDHELVKHLFDELRPRFEGRNSGYTRIFLLGTRPGDGAQMAVLEMVVKGESKKVKKSTSGKTKSSKSSDKKEPEKPKKTKASAESKQKPVNKEAPKKKKAARSRSSKKTADK
jgi:large subunit ribosomal protein L17